METTNTAITTIDDKRLITVMQNSLYPGAKEDSVRLVLDYCRARGLDPLQKPVHIVPMWNAKTEKFEDVIMPGLNLYRTQAAQSGLLAGIDDTEFGPVREFEYKGVKRGFGKKPDESYDITIKAPEWAKVKVRRILSNGAIGAFSHTEYFEEAVSLSKSGEPTPMWVKRPRGMLAKTAESQALRKAFPDIAGASETAEEMEGKTLFGEEQQTFSALTPEEKKIADEARAAAEYGTEAFRTWFKSIPPESRKALQLTGFDELKQIAAKADLKKKAQDAEVVA